MCRRIEKEVEPTVGLPRYRHFVGFFNVPVQAPTRDPPFYGYSEKPPHLVAFYDTHGDVLLISLLSNVNGLFEERVTLYKHTLSLNLTLPQVTIIRFKWHISERKRTSFPQYCVGESPPP